MHWHCTNKMFKLAFEIEMICAYCYFNLIRTKRSEQAKQAHSILREVEKMGHKKIPPIPV